MVKKKYDYSGQKWVKWGPKDITIAPKNRWYGIKWKILGDFWWFLKPKDKW
jgi:hypothetical protein